MVSSSHQPTCSPELASALNRLRRLNTQDIQAQWQISYEEEVQKHPNKVRPPEILDTEVPSHLPIASLNDRQHIAWEKGQNLIWLHQSITIPTQLHGYPLTGLILRLALTWWADDAQIYVNGNFAQSGDLFECFTRLCLSEQAIPGQTIRVAVRLISPAHDNGALVRSHLTYELPARYPTPEPSFIADELAVLATLEPESQPEIERAIAHLNWDSLKAPHAIEDLNDPDSAQQVWESLSSQSLPIPAIIHPFQQSLSQLRRDLQPYSGKIKQRQIQCVGHAHLDMAWLWPIPDTWNAAERTFRSVLNLQEDFPQLTYTHSSPALFEWIEHNRPELFKQIQTKVSEGSWSIDAGLWIEPEFNIISGESIVRQILYGQRYCQEKFGKVSTLAWLPDSFGFCWQLPQLLIQGGIETFATLKLSWNDTTEFPHQLFWWRSPDGTKILSIMLPPIGSDIDPTKMTDRVSQWQESTQIDNSLWLPGLGDHGGGPTRDMLEKAQRWQKSPFFPQLEFTTPEDHINSILEQAEQKEAIPTWTNELYLELHRGCYTTHADQKKHNRRCEDLLYQAEVFATVAHLIAEQAYPQTDIETAWKSLLFNQFHDILPGTSIPEVFEDANEGWKQVYQIGHQVLSKSLAAVASQISLLAPPHPEAKAIVIFNSLNWERNAVITLRLPKSSPGNISFNWAIQDAATSETIPHQIDFSVRAEQACCNLFFQAKVLPPIGYQVFWLYPTDSHTSHQKPNHYKLENEFITVKIDPGTGQIASLLEKVTQRETFTSPGNQLQAFQDKGQYWDAWNIDPEYKEHSLPNPTLQNIQWFESGPIRQKLRTTYKFQQSTINQDYILEAGSPYLKIETHIDWQESQVLLKAHFPFTLSSDYATYEIPFGAIERTTNPQTEVEKAQWEVPALRWANLSDKDFGVSILTDCKHGFDASQDHLRLTLLKSPIWPDPKADRGQHTFTYAIYAHRGTWKEARTPRLARELNISPIIYPIKDSPIEPTLNRQKHSFLSINNKNIVLSALKLAEDNDDTIVLRCYEAHGESTKLQITDSLKLSEIGRLQEGSRSNLLEHQILERSNHIKPWQVATYLLKKR